MGAEIIITQVNAATLDGAVKLIEKAESMGPLGGIFNLAMVLSDALIENQSAETFTCCFDPKGKATMNFDKITRESYPQLDYFVCFSSVSCGRGNFGQANYGYANSVMERICDVRRRDGLHGLTVQWGTVGDVGFVMDVLQGTKSF